MEIHERIKHIRTQNGLSQLEVASKIGIAYQNYWKIENGKTELTVSRLYQISEILGVSVPVLLGESVGEKDSKDSKYINDLEEKFSIVVKLLGVLTTGSNNDIDIMESLEQMLERIVSIEEKIDRINNK